MLTNFFLTMVIFSTTQPHNLPFFFQQADQKGFSYFFYDNIEDFWLAQQCSTEKNQCVLPSGDCFFEELVNQEDEYSTWESFLPASLQRDIQELLEEPSFSNNKVESEELLAVDVEPSETGMSALHDIALSVLGELPLDDFYLPIPPEVFVQKDEEICEKITEGKAAVKVVQRNWEKDLPHIDVEQVAEEFPHIDVEQVDEDFLSYWIQEARQDAQEKLN